MAEDPGRLDIFTNSQRGVKSIHQQHQDQVQKWTVGKKQRKQREQASTNEIIVKTWSDPVTGESEDDGRPCREHIVGNRSGRDRRWNTQIAQRSAAVRGVLDGDSIRKVDLGAEADATGSGVELFLFASLPLPFPFTI